MLIIGQDMGMGANKIFGPHGGIRLQSVVALDPENEIYQPEELTRSRKPLTVEIEKISFFVGSGAHHWGKPIENLDFDRMSGVMETRAILYGNLTQYILAHNLTETDQISMYVGLPHEYMTNDNKGINREKVRSWLAKDHTWISKGKSYSIQIQEVTITSQAVGAMMDYLLDDVGQYIPERLNAYQTNMGVITIGLNTVEIQRISERKLVQNASGGEVYGVRRFIEMLPDYQYSTVGEIDSILWSSSRNRLLQESKHLKVWTEQVLGVIEKTWNKSWKNFEVVLLAGGGARLIGTALIDYFAGKAIILDDPVFAVSRGLYKSALRKSQLAKK